jgi:hypothetical protein
MAKKQAESETMQSESSLVEIVVGPLKFNVASRYAEGHTATAAEAAALNQLVRENLRNTFRPVVQKVIDKAKEEGRSELSEEEVAKLSADFAQREAEYEFSKARGPRAPADPVGREAHKIAKQLILAALARKKVDPKSLAEGKLDELIAGVIASKPEITAEAKRRVDEQQSIANLALDL